MCGCLLVIEGLEGEGKVRVGIRVMVGGYVENEVVYFWWKEYIGSYFRKDYVGFLLGVLCRWIR